MGDVINIDQIKMQMWMLGVDVDMDVDIRYEYECRYWLLMWTLDVTCICGCRY